MILLIDNYDSFTYNLYQYIGEFNRKIKVIRNDEITCQEVENMKLEKIIISPGPKTPDEAGNCIEIIKSQRKKVPILGICLGHQCIGQAFGGVIAHAKKLYHGKTSVITHSKEGIFKGLPTPMKVARYHSLIIDPASLPKELKVIAKTDDGVIMAVKHIKYKVYGLQFHPESIYTPEGLNIIKNFIKGDELKC